MLRKQSKFRFFLVFCRREYGRSKDVMPVSEPEPEDPKVPDSRRAALLALGFILLLVLGGLLLEHVLSDSARLQDCVMQGRTNCAPVDSTAAGR